MKRGIALAALAALLAAAVLAGCGGGSSSSGSSSSGGGSEGSGLAKGEPIKVLSIADTTGETALYGKAHLAGIEAAAEYINTNGGVEGHEIEVIHESDNGDPVQSVTDLTKYLASNEPPTMVDAGAEGANTQALIPVIAKQDLYSLAVTDGAGYCLTEAATNCPNQYTTLPPTAVPLQAAAEWFKKEGVKKVGMLGEAIDFTEAEIRPFEEVLEGEGIKFSSVSFPATATSVTAEMSKLKSDGVEGLFVLAIGAAPGYALSARKQLDWDVPVVFDGAASSEDITKLVSPAEYENSYVDIYQVVNPEADLPGRKLLIEYGKKHGLDLTVPLNVSGLAWDEMLLLKNAVEQAKSTDFEALSKATLELNAKAKADPLYVSAKEIGFTDENHENVLGKPSDFVITPTGPIVEGQVK